RPSRNARSPLIIPENLATERAKRIGATLRLCNHGSANINERREVRRGENTCVEGDGAKLAHKRDERDFCLACGCASWNHGISTAVGHEKEVVEPAGDNECCGYDGENVLAGSFHTKRLAEPVEANGHLIRVDASFRISNRHANNIEQ